MAELTNIQDWQGAVAPSRAARVMLAIEAEQERWFLWLPVVFGLGIAGYFFLPQEPNRWALVAAASSAVLLHGFGRRMGHVALLTAAIAAACSGALCAKLRSDYVAGPILVRALSAVDVTGWIELVEPRPKAGQRITIRVLTLGTLSPETTPIRVRVRTAREDPALAPGQAIRVRATLGAPPLPSAPGDFDFGRLAWFSSLGGIGLARGPVVQLDDAGTPPFGLRVTAAIERVRQIIRTRIIAALPGETGEIATALITGERGGITEATNQAYRDSGLFHILSISGLHMVIMAGAVFYLLRITLAAIPAIALRYPIKKWSAAGAILGALGYLLISGASFATVRSYVMITIMFMAVMLDRPAVALRNVALAALLILLVYPESLFDAGFQMSFAAVTGLVSAYEYLRERRATEGARIKDERRGPIGQGAHFVGEIMLTSIIASVVVAPFGIYHFHNTQSLALIANLFAIPICNAVVMPAALGVLIALPLGLEAVPLWVMGLGIDAMTGVARIVGAFPGAVIKVAAIPTVSFALMVAGGLWLLLWTQPWRLLGVVPIALGIIVAPTLTAPDVLVGRDGTTVAVRASNGRYAVLASRGSAFELARWLELDGDRRPAADVAAETRGFQCDQLGCRASAGERVVVIAMSPAALRDDCARADILILRFLAPRACLGAARSGQIIVDPGHLARAGAHAIYLTGAAARVETVADARGNRLWSGPLTSRTSPDDPRAGDTRMSGFTSLFARFRPARPEIDDDAWPRSAPVEDAR